MKKILILFAIIASAVSANAQTKPINLELLGSSGMAGVNYDARFKGNHGLGYSIGDVMQDGINSHTIYH